MVEQTEFIDDASFQVFRASGKQEPYVRRCAGTRLNSAEKLMYICKNQLGTKEPNSILSLISQVVPQVDESVKLYNHGEGPY